jgi:flagellar hook-associated protein 2
MGTVGLSFGSPTSGVGFNVSSTVAEIVSNLQNVETPWNTQLTALGDQDTVISNLGSLLSNVSTDIGQLTDFEGVLAQKEGSSSDTNVLDLTAATSSSAAGSYAVVVNSLATTANGYLDPIADASDALSGSMTIQANGGTTYTFDIGGGTSSGNTIYTGSGENTLANLVSSINSADIGVTASVTTDANGSRLSLVSNTSGAGGSIAATASITDAKTSTALNYNANLATGANASLSINGVSYSAASNTVSNLIPGVTFQLLGTSASGSQVQVVIANDNSGVESTVNQFVNDYNSLISAVNAQEGNDSSGNPEPLFGSPTLTLLQQELLSSITAGSPNGTLDSISATAGVTLSGSVTLQVGSGTNYTFQVGAGTNSGSTFYTGDGNNTLADLASTINSANIGVTAGVVTSNGQSTLTLSSQTAGANGTLSVISAIEAATPSALTFTDSGYTSTTPDSGTLGSTASSSDTLAGSVTVQVSGGSPQTIDMNTVNSAEGGSTLADLQQYIASNSFTLGFTASPGTNNLTLTSNTNGSAGALAVTSNLYDTTNSTNSTLAYNNSSDLAGLTALGISVNNDGSLSFDATSLDSLLNTDYTGVVGFFQSVDSWGQNFSNMLTNAGSSSSTGILKLAANANSTTESTLHAELSKEQSYISAQQSSLTTELNQANEILQQLPSELQGLNELYAAITGYNQTQGG